MDGSTLFERTSAMGMNPELCRSMRTQGVLCSKSVQRPVQHLKQNRRIHFRQQILYMIVSTRTYRHGYLAYICIISCLASFKSIHTKKFIDVSKHVEKMYIVIMCYLYGLWWRTNMEDTAPLNITTYRQQLDWAAPRIPEFAVGHEQPDEGEELPSSGQLRRMHLWP